MHLSWADVKQGWVGYYGKFPCDIGSGTSFPYHCWTNIPKLEFLNSQGYSGGKGRLDLCWSAKCWSPKYKRYAGEGREGGGGSGFWFFTKTASGFGCTTGAFSYSSLHHKKCQDAGSDYGNPNIYNALDNIKVISTTVAIGWIEIHHSCNWLKWNQFRTTASWKMCTRKSRRKWGSGV